MCTPFADGRRVDEYACACVCCVCFLPNNNQLNHKTYIVNWQPSRQPTTVVKFVSHNFVFVCQKSGRMFCSGHTKTNSLGSEKSQENL